MSSSSSNSNVSFSQFQDLFDAALRKYGQKTGTDLATDPLITALENCNSLDAVLEILQYQADTFDQFRDGGWMVQLMRRLEPTVDILLRLSTSGIFGHAVGLKFPPAQVIFAGVGHLIAAAKGVDTSYGALIGLFECFEHYLGRLKVLTEIPFAVGEISIKIMVELLDVLALATQQIKQGRFKKFAKKLLGENDVEAVLQRLDRLTMEESRMTATQTMEVVYGLFNNMKVVMDDGKASIDNVRGALVAMQRISDDLNKMKCDQLREKIRKWLSPPDPSTNHNTACEAHHNGTATWFLEGSLYNEWKAEGSLLWTHGNPGSGKSVLCSSITNDIESIRATGLASVAYYYFDFQDTGKQDRRGLLSSLLTQLCTQSHHGYGILSTLYESHQNGLRQPSEVDLIQCLKNVLTLPDHGRVYILVDAVDESPNKPGIPSPREKVLQLIKELVDLRDTDLRVCITSRPEVDIRTVLEPLASHSMSLHDERGQTRDIINYIESVVRSNPNMQNWRPEDRQLVIDSLSQKANGMFRWVVCQLDTLRRCFPASIRHALDELPVTLDETYERILLGIDREKRKHAIRLLQCLAFTRRPLRAKELAEVFAIQFDTPIPKLDTGLRPGDANEAVLSACSTLVAIIKPDHLTVYNNDSRLVQFSHYSVKEFLTSERLAKSDKGDLSQYYISPEPAHTVLARTCISILLQPDLHIGDITGRFPLAKYSAQNWFYHAQYDGVASQVQDAMECLFDPDRNHFATWISIHDIDDRPSIQTKPSPLYYAALCGIGSLVEHLIVTRHQDPNESHGSQGTPLHVAAVSGHISVAQPLLEHTADVNARDMDHRTPLHAAARNGNVDIAQLLLSHDAGVNVRNIHHSTPLQEAAGSGNLNIVLLLVSYEADVNILGYQGDSPLHKAVRSQNLEVVELLLKCGAHVNARDSIHNSTPLHEAAESGNFDMVQLLLDHGAYVNALDRQKDSPLRKALRSQKLDVVELLLKRGADVNTRDVHNSTLLHEAVGSKNIDTMKILLRYDADVNALDYVGDSPLHKALQSQNIALVEFPGNSAVDGNAWHDQFFMLRLRALQQGNRAIAQLLLGYRADVNARGYRQMTPLHLASLGGGLDLPQLLIQYGADIDVQDDEGHTPFSIALANEHHELARFLSNDRLPKHDV